MHGCKNALAFSSTVIPCSFFSPQDTSVAAPQSTDVCVNYCTEGNCTVECRHVSDNNHFRINNIVPGANYTISVSLRNSFGQSRQTTTLYGEGKAVSAMNISIYIVYAYDFYFSRL